MPVIADAAAGKTSESTDGEVGVVLSLANHRVVIVDSARNQNSVTAVDRKQPIESSELARRLRLCPTGVNNGRTIRAKAPVKMVKRKVCEMKLSVETQTLSQPVVR